MGRTFAIGDLHGDLDAFLDLLLKWGFKPSEDVVISVGDVCDYGYKTAQLIGVMSTMVDNGSLIAIRGNHDAVLQIWAEGRGHLYNWSHGGRGTLQSYSDYLEMGFDFAGNMMKACDFPHRHLRFLQQQKDYHIHKGVLYCHAGIDIELSLENQVSDEFYQNRSLYKLAKKGLVNLDGYNEFDKIVVGHTITHDNKPFISKEVINLDTGVKKKDGYLTMMDMDTLEYKQVKSSF